MKVPIWKKWDLNIKVLISSRKTETKIQVKSETTKRKENNYRKTQQREKTKPNNNNNEKHQKKQEVEREERRKEGEVIQDDTWTGKEIDYKPRVTFNL